MASKSILMAWKASLAASAAGFVFCATAAQAQVSRDPLELPTYDPQAPLQQGEAMAGRRPPQQSLIIQPRIGVRAIVTDNAYLTESNHKTDLVTNPYVGLSLQAAGPRSAAQLKADIGYDSYSRAHQLNGWSYVGYGAGEFDIVRQFLLMEANASVTNGSVTAFGVPALDRSGVQGRTQIVNLAAGPRLTATVGDLLDLTALARVGWVGYSAADGSLATTPTDSTFRQASASATTGGRYASHQVTVSANYQADDDDFRTYGGLVSVFVPVGADFRLLARGGVDDVRESGVIDLQAPIWSVGFEYDLNQTSYLRLEGGRRYHENSFAAESRISITDRFYFFGSYKERILPAQLGLADDFLGFVSNSESLPTPLVDSSFGVLGPLLDETSRDKVAQIRGVYTWPDQEIGVTGAWVRRRLLASNTQDETFDTTVSYLRRMRPDLRGEVSVTYSRNLTDPGSDGNRRWGGSATLIFDLNTTVQIIGGYSYANDKQTLVGGPRLVENVAFASITKSF